MQELQQKLDAHVAANKAIVRECDAKIKAFSESMQASQDQVEELRRERDGYQRQSSDQADEAIKWRKQVGELEAALREIKNELGVPDENYPARVANAVDIADRALDGEDVSDFDLAGDVGQLRGDAVSDYFDAIAHALAKESNERLAQRVKDGITAELPGDWHPEGTQTRVPTERQLHEAYVAAQELERRAGGKPEPIKTWEPVMTDADLLRFDEVVHGFSVVKAGRRVDPVEVKPVGGNLPEPDWWVKDDGSASIRHPLTTEEEMVVELPERRDTGRAGGDDPERDAAEGRGRRLARPRREGTRGGESGPEGAGAKGERRRQ